MPIEQIPTLAWWITWCVILPAYLWLTARPFWSWTAKKYPDKSPNDKAWKNWILFVVNISMHIAFVLAIGVVWTLAHWIKFLIGVIFG